MIFSGGPLIETDEKDGVQRAVGVMSYGSSVSEYLPK